MGVGADKPARFPLPAAEGDDARITRVRIGREEYVVLSVVRDAHASAPNVALTDAERAVEEAILAGMSNAAIARARGTSLRTVANQVASLFRKRGVRSRAELAASCARPLRARSKNA